MNTILISDTPVRRIVNFRELGGYRTSDGRAVRRGFFYRSGGLYLMKEEELSYVRSLRIDTVIDLRTKAEAAKKPDPSLPDVHMIQYSGVVSKGGEEIDFSPAGMSQIGEAGRDQIRKLREYYRQMPFDNEAFRLLISEIVKEHLPILFHCATGKDRTGIAAMIVLLMLGVPEETVLQDYLLSNEYRKDIIGSNMKKNADIIRQHPEYRDLVQMRRGVSPDVGRSVLKEIRSRYGTRERYFEEEYGLDREEIAFLRGRYLTAA